jgi:hypothetical protein
MTYNDAENLACTYSSIIGRPLLNKLVCLDNRKITSLLVSSREKIKEVFTTWWHNGNDNEKAIIKKNKKDTNFEVFLMSYDPSEDSIIYYLRLTKYMELENSR